MRATLRHRLGYLRLRRFGYLFCAFLALPFLAFAAWIQIAAAQSPNADTVKIGLIMTYTGQFTDAAAQMDNGIKLYMKQHGDTVAGKKIEIIRKDDGGAPDNAKRIAQDLIVNDHADVLAGFVITPEALTVADISAQAKKLMVVMNAATSIITTKSPYIVRTSTTLPEDCEPLGTWAAKNGIKKVFTMVSDYGPGHDAEAAFTGAFKAGGGEVIELGTDADGEPGFLSLSAARQGFRSGRDFRLHPWRLAAGCARQSAGRTRHGYDQDQAPGPRRACR